jgi:hypothetical protein
LRWLWSRIKETGFYTTGAEINIVATSSHFINKQSLSANCSCVREVYKWRYSFGQTERLNFIAEPLGLATQGNLGLVLFCYMYK